MTTPGTSVNEILASLKLLTNMQEGIVKSFDTTLAKIDNEQDACEDALRAAVKDMVPVGNAKRYEQISAAAKEANVDFDASHMVREWTANDSANRTNRAGLEAAHGDLTDAKKEAAAETAKLAVMKQALEEMATEVEAFEGAAREINEHNAKYQEKRPEFVVNTENREELEAAGLFSKSGRKAGRKVLEAFEERTGQNYFTYKSQVDALAEDKAALEALVTTQETASEAAAKAATEMTELDANYMGPEAIANEVRQQIFNLVVSDDDFAVLLNDHMQSENAHKAALSIAKIRTYDAVKSQVSELRGKAQAALESLSSPLDTLEGAATVAGKRRVDFELPEFVTGVQGYVDLMRTAVKQVERTIAAVEKYVETEGKDYKGMQEALTEQGNVGFTTGSLEVDFTELEKAVREEQTVCESEASVAKAAAAEAEQTALADMKSHFETAAAVRALRAGATADLTEVVVPEASEEQPQAPAPGR